VKTPDVLANLLTRTGPILLDFDGPVCSVFAGYPAPTVACELRQEVTSAGIELPPSITGESDPLEVLRWAGSLGRTDIVNAVEEALCGAELRAVRSAVPTPYGREVIVAARQAGRPVAVVSNNSAPAVAAYLAAHRLDQHICAIIGRTYGDPGQMKPNAAPILRAVTEVGATPDACLMVGDSLTDIIGAKAAGVAVVAYANKPAKLTRFTDAAPDAVIAGMDELAAALLASTTSVSTG